MSNEFKMLFDYKKSEFDYPSDEIKSEDSTKKELCDVVNNAVFYQLIQKDDAKNDSKNDCWSEISFFNRKENSTLLSNDSSKVLFSNLLDDTGERFILPNTFFTVEFTFISNLRTTLRFANLKGSYINIDLYDLHLSEGDNLKIRYRFGDIFIYQNDSLIDRKHFIVEKEIGYLTWRVPEESYVEFSDFKIYIDESSYRELLTDNIYLKKEYTILADTVQRLERKYNYLEKTANEKLESANFLFNTLYMDYELKPKNLLKDMQMLCTELLIFVDNICKKYNLEWWLDYGNLIGAIRHNSFVPWDDDVDIGMMREDYNKFNEVLQKEIDAHGLNDLITVSYRKRKIDKDTVNAFIQIFILHDLPDRINTIFAGVDIFAYDYLRDYDKDNIEEVYDNARNEYYRSLTKGSEMKQLYMGLDSDDVLPEYYKNLNLSTKKEKYITPGVEGACGPHNIYKLLILDYDTVFPLKNVKFNGMDFPCPNDHDTYLKSIYGDYMLIPANIRTHHRVNKLRYDFGIEQVFKNDYKRLKGINDDFE